MVKDHVCTGFAAMSPRLRDYVERCRHVQLIYMGGSSTISISLHAELVRNRTSLQRKVTPQPLFVQR
jgi:hypothetical protein